MGTEEIMGLAILLPLTIISFTIAVLSFKHKIRVLTNPYLWLSPEQREKEIAKVGVKFVYKQQGTIFLLSALITGFILITIFVPMLPLAPVSTVLVVVMAVYAIVSSVLTYKRNLASDKDKR